MSLPRVFYASAAARALFAGHFLAVIALLLAISASSSYSQVPPAPTSLAATPGNAQVALHWVGATTMVSWSIDNSGGYSFGPYYGPLTDFTPTAVAAGADGMTRVVWNKNDGTAQLWLLDATNTTQSQYSYGPYGAWTAADVAVGSDNKARILWTRTDGAMAVWTVDNAGTPTYGPIYGPYPGNTAARIACGVDGFTRVLWSKTDSSAGLWLMNADNTYRSSSGYGPYAGWTIADITVGSDGSARLLWINANGTIQVWSVAATGAASYGPVYGPYTGFTASRIAAGSDGLTRVLWNKTDGTATFWLMNADNTYQTSFGYGPYAGWMPLDISVGSDNKARLLWSSSAATSYNVKRSTTAGGPYTLLTPSPAVPAFTDTGLTNGTTYYYVVSAVNGSGESVNSTEVSVTPAVPPSVPTGLTATAGDAQVALNWTASTGAVSYNVKRSTTSGGPYMAAGATTGTTYTDAGVLDGTTYYYVVSAIGATGVESGASGEAYATPNATPSTPGGLTVTPGDGMVTLSWPAVPGATGYTVQRFDLTSGTYIAIATTITPAYWDTGLNNGSQYTYRVSASNGSIQGSPSGSANGTPVTIGSGVASDIPPPGWAAGAVPTDEPDVTGLGPSSSMRVSLPAGVAENLPGPDIEAFNPVGPSVSYTRMYRSALAKQGYNTPGLSPGWVDNFDLAVLPVGTTRQWGSLKLRYPNGAVELWTPVLNGAGAPTGALTPPAGAPYTVSGVPDPDPNYRGVWDSLTMTLKDHSSETFGVVDPAALGNKGWLTTISNSLGHNVTIDRNGDSTLSSVENDASQVLLSFQYDGGGYLQDVVAHATGFGNGGRIVSYGFQQKAGANCLVTVSQVQIDIPPLSAGVQWQYDYTSILSKPYLSVVMAPNPVTGTGMNSCTISYDTTLGRVNYLQDANNIRRQYAYGSSAAQVQVYNADGTAAQHWTQCFDPTQNNVDTGFTDDGGHHSTLAYTDPLNTYRPTVLTNSNLQSAKIAYGPYGNASSTTDSRQASVVPSYDYTAFALGHVTSVKEQSGASSLAPTSMDYYGVGDHTPAPDNRPLFGLVKDIYSPVPGISGSLSTTTTSLQYDGYGNIATETGPGNNATDTIQVSYDYTNGYGGYTQSEVVGEPVTTTVTGGGINSRSYAEYDEWGRQTASLDGMGYRTEYTYNDSDQLTQVKYPSTSQTGTGNVTVRSVYLYPGGPLQSVSTYDENNVLFRQVNYAYGPEGEQLSVSGSTLPASYTYDGRYRVTTVKDGNNFQTSYHYDPVTGNLQLVNYPGGNGVSGADVFRFTYDNDNNLVQQIDGNGQEIDYLRADPESLVTGIHYGGATPPVQFTYDLYGRRESMSDGSGVKAYTYDDLDSLTGVTTSFSSGSQGGRIGYSYYLDGSRQAMSTPAGAYTYLYDGIGRLTQLSFPQAGSSQATTFNYLRHEVA